MPTERKEVLDHTVRRLEQAMELETGDLELTSASAGRRGRYYSVMLGGTPVFEGTFATRRDAIHALKGAGNAIRVYKRRQKRRR